MTYQAATQKLIDHPEALAAMARRVALAAGAAIMDHYDPAGFQGTVDLKKDNSPVTIADLEADRIIRTGLSDLTPDIPMLTEETADTTDRAALSATRHYWLVDGLDGTKAFRAGDPDFTVNIALIDGDTPVLGVVYAPAHAEGYVGVVGGAAYRFRDDDDRDVEVTGRALPRRGLTVLTSHTSAPKATEQFMSHLKVDRHIKRHSSIKYTDVARGAADVALTIRNVWYWDSAAADAVLRAAGGIMIDMNGATLRYDRTREIWENHGVMATFDPAMMQSVLREGMG